MELKPQHSLVDNKRNTHTHTGLRFHLGFDHRERGVSRISGRARERALACQPAVLAKQEEMDRKNDNREQQLRCGRAAIQVATEFWPKNWVHGSQGQAPGLRFVQEMVHFFYLFLQKQQKITGRLRRIARRIGPVTCKICNKRISHAETGTCALARTGACVQTEVSGRARPIARTRGKPEQCADLTARS